MMRSMCVGLTALALAMTVAGARAAAPTFSASGIDDAMDLHGNPCNAQLVLFVSGNQWMVMPELLAEFRREHPGIDRVFYETLPPGVLAKQLESGSLTVGELSLSPAPDVFMSGARRMRSVVAQGLATAPVVYATNVIAIAVREGNPKHVESLADLGRPGIRVAMPNPAFEGVGHKIEQAYRKAGGQQLVERIMVGKVRDGTTILTEIHHRQTPLWLIEGRVDAGPLWLSEALYQQRIGAPIETIRVPPRDNVTAHYEAAVVSRAPHATAARDFVNFLSGQRAREIFRSFGFGDERLSATRAAKRRAGAAIAVGS